MKRTWILLVALMAVLALVISGCRGRDDGRIRRTFDFRTGLQDWVGDFSDLPVNYDPELFQLGVTFSPRPEELGSGRGLRVSGRNASDDLFMYVKRRLTAADGLLPNTTYYVRFTVEFATSALAGTPGGDSVWMKTGVAPIEPIAVSDQASRNPNLILNVDKGRQNEDGVSAVRIGNVAKTENQEIGVYESKTLNNHDNPIRVTADAQGNLWIFVGTDSGYPGITTLYYTNITVELEKIVEPETAQ